MNYLPRMNNRGFENLKDRLRLNNRGFEMAINTIIVIVLAVLLLIVLVFILNYQTGLFSDYIKNLGGKTNVDVIITGCNTLASQNSVYEYCCVKKKIIYSFNGSIKSGEFNCGEISNMTFINNRIEVIPCQNVC